MTIEQFLEELGKLHKLYKNELSGFQRSRGAGLSLEPPLQKLSEVFAEMHSRFWNKELVSVEDYVGCFSSELEKKVSQSKLSQNLGRVRKVFPSATCESALNGEYVVQAVIGYGKTVEEAWQVAVDLLREEFVVEQERLAEIEMEQELKELAQKDAHPQPGEEGERRVGEVKLFVKNEKGEYARVELKELVWKEKKDDESC